MNIKELFKDKKKLVLIVLLIVFLAVFVFAAVQFCLVFFAGRFDSGEFKTSSNAEVTSSKEENLPDNPIDFKALSEQNYDAYAWITIPGTKVDYPILQAYFEDDNFYLEHDIDKNKSRAGALYTQRANQKNFFDSNTIIYGHNMANGTMFRTLHYFKDREFFDQNRYFYIYTSGNIYTYEIFAAYRYDDRHILNSFDFNNKEVYAQYLNDIFSLTANANIRTDTKVDTDSKIVTLSTCYANSKPEYRYLVQGVMIKHEKTK